MTGAERTDVEPKRTALGWQRWENLPTGRTLVMGILNVTPDSFSDGGQHDTHRAAVEHGRLLTEQGADMVDVGGEPPVRGRFGWTPQRNDAGSSP